MKVIFSAAHSGSDTLHIVASQAEMRELATRIRLGLIRCTTDSLMINVAGAATVCEEGAEELE
jgi:hypothetical protein